MLKRFKKRTNLGPTLLAVVAGLGVAWLAPLDVGANQIVGAEAAKPAKVAIEVSPTNQAIDLQPGQIYNGEFQVKNSGASGTLVFEPSASPYGVSGDSYENKLYDEGLVRTEITRWISFNQDSYQLEPGQSTTVHYTVNTPVDAPGGGQYAALLASSKTETGDKNDGSSVLAINSVGMILRAHVAGDTREAGEVTSFAMPFWNWQPPVPIEAVVKNTGNVDFEMKYKIATRSVFGGEAVVRAEGSHVIYPDTEYTLKEEWSKAPLLGLYFVDAEFEIFGDSQSYSQLIVICPDYMLVMILAIILLVTIMIVTAIARHKKPVHRNRNKR
jgi:hypothetical protein